MDSETKLEKQARRLLKDLNNGEELLEKAPSNHAKTQVEHGSNLAKARRRIRKLEHALLAGGCHHEKAKQTRVLQFYPNGWIKDFCIHDRYGPLARLINALAASSSSPSIAVTP